MEAYIINSVRFCNSVGLNEITSVKKKVKSLFFKTCPNYEALRCHCSAEKQDNKLWTGFHVITCVQNFVVKNKGVGVIRF